VAPILLLAFAIPARAADTGHAGAPACCTKVNAVSENSPGASSRQKPMSADQTQILQTMSTLFTALAAEDTGKFDAVAAPDFYLFEGGTRFEGHAMVGLVKTMHAAGKRYAWNVTESDVHVTGNAAWIAYVNKGSITDASGTTEQKWLESGFLEKQSGIWKIVFLHSTRVPAPAHGGHKPN
jgi:ketosteroid isomerase-like protein